MFVAQELGFGGVAENSLDAVSNRDFVLDYLGAAATCATHLSQLGAEIVLWSTEEFGFCEVADAFASGSSLMPQKKNPDAAELLRAKAPRMVGRLIACTACCTACRSPTTRTSRRTRSRSSTRSTRSSSACAWPPRCSRGSTFDRERMAAAASDEFLAATDVADLLVRRGVPFREAHGIVGGLVRAAVERGKKLSELTDEELAELAPAARPAASRAARAGAWLESKVSRGRHLARAGARPARAGAPRARGGVTPRGSSGVLRALGARRGARPRRLRRPPRRDRRAGSSRPRATTGGAGLPRLRRADAAHEHALRPARFAYVYRSYGDPRAAERGGRGARAWARRC